jgi:hypothetical protein
VKAGPDRLADRRRAEAERAGDFFIYVVARPLMFVAWALVFWGTAIALASVFVLATRGPGAALAVLVPHTALDLLNSGLAVVAMIVWLAVAVVASGRRRRR